MRDTQPLPLKQKDIREFQSAYKQRYGIELADDTARRELTRIVQLMVVIYAPAPYEQEAADNGN